MFWQFFVHFTVTHHRPTPPVMLWPLLQLPSNAFVFPPLPGCTSNEPVVSTFCIICFRSMTFTDQRLFLYPSVSCIFAELLLHNRHSWSITLLVERGPAVKHPWQTSEKRNEEQPCTWRFYNTEMTDISICIFYRL